MTGTHSNKKNLCELDVLASESHKQHTTSSVRGKSQLIGQALWPVLLYVSWSLLLCRGSSGSVAWASS